MHVTFTASLLVVAFIPHTPDVEALGIYEAMMLLTGRITEWCGSFFVLILFAMVAGLVGRKLCDKYYAVVEKIAKLEEKCSDS